MAETRERVLWQTGRHPDSLLGCKEPLEPGVVSPRQVRPSKKWGHTVKKLLVLALVALGGLLVWRKVQADRAELDLWTEATGSDN
ncbi:hypothetical protein Misp01_48180 [Microtetraspora sp. NBRC 13810]|nr:hypothetical protein Misp01_48180 [Microtetraspora sp. NBRC 13810]